jgi:hypothetical protein
LQIVVNNNETRMAAFEISAKNRKNRENNKREQARPKEINHLAKASCLILNSSHAHPTGGRSEEPAKQKARRDFRPGFPQLFQIALSYISLVTLSTICTICVASR